MKKSSGRSSSGLVSLVTVTKRFKSAALLAHASARFKNKYKNGRRRGKRQLIRQGLGEERGGEDGEGGGGGVFNSTIAY